MLEYIDSPKCVGFLVQSTLKRKNWVRKSDGISKYGSSERFAIGTPLKYLVLIDLI